MAVPKLVKPKPLYRLRLQDLERARHTWAGLSPRNFYAVDDRPNARPDR